MPVVLLLCEYPTLNGGEQSMLSTLDGVRAAGFLPRVMCPAEGPLAAALHSRGIETIPWECCDPNGVRVPQDRLRLGLAVALQKSRPALLHANSLAMGRLSGPVARELQTPSIAHLRDIVGLSARAIADINEHSRLLAVSGAVRDFHVAKGLLAEKTHVLHNGVDLERLCPRAMTGRLHRQLGLPNDARLVGTIGQLGLRKGQDVLLRAAQSLADRLPNVHYVLVGERHSNKEESRQFEAHLHEIASGALAGHVHFLGFRNDVDQLLAEFTLLVHPARQEPLGRVLLEAAAAGLAVIATDVGGTREIFSTDDFAALLIPPNDAERLADALSRLVNDDSARGQLAAAARCRAEKQFDVRTAAEGLVRHYQAVV
jgi:glycosyltransferase involved in cell wall biosynthesis